MNRAVVLLSGGQDSTTCLFWALNQGATHVLALSVNYGQKHARELAAADAVTQVARFRYPDAVIDREVIDLPEGILASTSPLVSGEPLGQYESVEDLPGGVEPTFVPGRNLLFLVLAANRAAAFNADGIVTGVAQEDFGGYFDCREEFVDAMQVALAQGFVGRDDWIEVYTPLMNLDKRETVLLADEMEGCMEALALSHTCYAGEYPPCGKCHACHLRARGFEQAGIPDPLLTRA